MGLAPDFDEHRHRELSEVRIEPAQAADFVHQFLPEDRLAAVPGVRERGVRAAGLPLAWGGFAASGGGCGG